ncbi:MAG: DNA repair protein RecN [Methylococcales bacterium]|jgi:DNA repair protein RecN (Recombination protein N)|nr:DNA repair protein RecN [Methylococcales bacterium]MBT7444547.1 DNA repair protein RecN [Methylococcales bacterium]
MLTHIFVKNLAIMEHLSLDLSNGMSVITGETGAGKSILIDALSLAFGERADARAIRSDCDKAEISLSFDLAQLPQVQSWLEQNELEADGECITRRILIKEGRSKAYINGRPTPISALKQLGELMIDIHSQHAHQQLLKKEHQLNLLDDFAHHQLLVQDIGALFKELKNIQHNIEKLENQAKQEQARITLIQYQIDELLELALSEGEQDQLNDEHKRLANAEQLLSSSQQACDTLFESDNCIHNQLSFVDRELETLGQCDTELKETEQLIKDALIAITEASTNLRNYQDQIELDPERLSWVESRLDSIQTIARKHHVSPEQLPQHLLQLQTERGAFEQIESQVAEQHATLQKLEKKYHSSAKKLSKQRQKSAKTLSASVSKAIKPLGMPNATFEIHIESQEQLSAKGYDHITYLVSTNKGQTLQPMAQIASGGELSRISLAIQVEAARYAKIPTLVFDEVDVGIGGGVAEVVGKLIRTLGDSRQVICITHLPQVACQGHHHLQVSKSSDKKSTRTQIKTLEDKQRVQEIARMLGGMELTEQTLAHAKEMLNAV